MQAVKTIGLDIAKSVFQVHGVDADGQVVIRRKLKRCYMLAFFQKMPQCLIGMEACATSHHWSKELQTLGHRVRLMPPAYVRPYVERQKNDAADAEAICEVVAGTNMRFVGTKTTEQQSCLVLHRTRHLFMVGRDGVIGSGAALNGRVSLNQAIVQIGGRAQRCPVEPLKEFLQKHTHARSLMGAHEQALLAQAQQAAACNATHVIESRLARWLLRAADLHGGDELLLTQEYIAQMLGVRRMSVTVVARTLQEAGMIRYKRVHMKMFAICNHCCIPRNLRRNGSISRDLLVNA